MIGGLPVKSSIKSIELSLSELRRGLSQQKRRLLKHKIFGKYFLRGKRQFFDGLFLAFFRLLVFEVLDGSILIVLGSNRSFFSFWLWIIFIYFLFGIIGWIVRIKHVNQFIWWAQGRYGVERSLLLINWSQYQCLSVKVLELSVCFIEIASNL